MLWILGHGTGSCGFQHFPSNNDQYVRTKSTYRRILFLDILHMYAHTEHFNQILGSCSLYLAVSVICYWLGPRPRESDHPSLSHSVSLWKSWAITLVSCRQKNLKGSGINKRTASQSKLQQGFSRHASSGAMPTHKELSVRAVLHIPVEYSLTYTQHRMHISCTWK